METSRKRTVLLAGATGLVGREILRLLKDDDRIAEVRALVRRPLPAEDKTFRVRECLIDFDYLGSHPEWFCVDQVFSALGTTIAVAGSQQAFRRVDFEYPLAIAKAALGCGARHFLFVSALGANSRSLFFYNRVKGELEDSIRSLGFPSVTMARPSLLIGERHPARFGEEFANRFSWLAPERWKPVHAGDVARALVRASEVNAPGEHILENRELRGSR